MTRKIILSILLCIATSTIIQAKPKKVTLYMFGVSASLTDSVTYMTDIQLMKPLYIEKKTGFLYDRSIYSQQLQIYVEDVLKHPSTTCAVFFAKKLPKAQKMFIQVRNKLKKDPSTRVVTMEKGAFSFIPEEWTEHEDI